MGASTLTPRRYFATRSGQENLQHTNQLTEEGNKIVQKLDIRNISVAL